MKKKMAIFGYGQRGSIYGNYCKFRPDEFEVVAIIENNENRMEKAKREFSCSFFSDYRDFLNANIPADIVAIATQDNDHLEHSVACMEKGYDILLEKPIATKLSDCLEIDSESMRLDRKVIVCHVLRYSPFYRKVKEIVDSGVIGDIITLNASENVGYYHQAHSFVRGPWRNEQESCPMILAKCCHDMDLIRWIIGKKCRSVSSVGGLSVFKRENAPKGSADFCCDCNLDCIYNAQKLYLTHRGMANYFYAGTEPSDEIILKALSGGQYDRCVYKCDNNVVDHQNTVMTFEDGVTASHVMTAFSNEIYRDIKIHGTLGELVGIMEDNWIEVRLFGKETVRITIDVSQVEVGGHGGGDMGLMHDVYMDLNGEMRSGISYINVSVDSHKMAFSAEQSRKCDGIKVEIDY